MEMLCIAAEATPTGYVLVNGRAPTTTDLARLTGEPEAVIQSALAELDAAGVYSRDRKGRIFSRRMVREVKTSATNRKNGKLGGNPTLCDTEKTPDPVKGALIPKDKPQEPLAMNPKSENLKGGSLPRAHARAGSPFIDAAERKARWQSRMLQEAQATMTPKRFGELVAAIMEDPSPPWAKAELERLDRQVKRQRLNGAAA